MRRRLRPDQSAALASTSVLWASASTRRLNVFIFYWPLSCRQRTAHVPSAVFFTLADACLLSEPSDKVGHPQPSPVEDPLRARGVFSVAGASFGGGLRYPSFRTRFMREGTQAAADRPRWPASRSRVLRRRCRDRGRAWPVGPACGESILSFSHEQGEDGATRVTSWAVWGCPRLSEPSEE